MSRKSRKARDSVRKSDHAKDAEIVDDPPIDDDGHEDECPICGAPTPCHCDEPDGPL